MQVKLNDDQALLLCKSAVARGWAIGKSYDTGWIYGPPSSSWMEDYSFHKCRACGCELEHVGEGIGCGSCEVERYFSRTEKFEISMALWIGWDAKDPAKGGVGCK